MNKHITVGIDGSHGAAKALDWAASEASRTGYSLEIVHALDLPGTRDVHVQVTISTVSVNELHRFSRGLLAAAARRAEEIAPGINVWTRPQLGSAAGVLVAASREAALLVVGTRGLGALGSFLGSVSTKVATRSSCPVVVIPDRGHGFVPFFGPIVVGVDDSAYSTAALGFALSEARCRKTTVRAVTAYQAPMVSSPLDQGVLTSLEQSEHDHACEVIDKIAADARTPETEDIKIESVVVRGPTAESIMSEAADAQLIVVGSHGRAIVRRVLLGSVSRRVLHEADRPVAVVDIPH
jgi:nucleotide-binding universal stress UspA family protein